MIYKRLTTRQGIIEDSAKMLATRFPYQSEQNYRQNAWSVFPEVVKSSHKCQRYYLYAHVNGRALTLLYTAIAKAAVNYDRRFNFRLPCFR